MVFGLCGPSKKQLAIESKRTNDIDKGIRQEKKRLNREAKLLLLGAGESGKSTIIKQMRFLYAKGFNRSEREKYRAVIFSNLVFAFNDVIEGMRVFRVSFDSNEHEKIVVLLSQERELGRNEPFPLEYKEAFLSLWEDMSFRRVVARGNEFALHDNLDYYMDHIDRLFARDYTPNDQDILRSRVKTSGISEAIFNHDLYTYRIFDVGGQRSERKKWIHCFENVNGLLFLVAISGYDQCLVEDQDSNQMLEALMLFEAISNSQWFMKTSVILFMNKMDLFKLKLRSSPIPTFFPDFKPRTSITDVGEASQFFLNKFKALNRTSTKEIYSHFTNATDTDLVKNTMDDVRDIIVQTQLRSLML